MESETDKNGLQKRNEGILDEDKTGNKLCDVKTMITWQSLHRITSKYNWEEC